MKVQLWETEELKGISRGERFAFGVQQVVDKCRELEIFEVTCSEALTSIFDRFTQSVFTWETDSEATEDYVQIGETKITFELFEPDPINDKLHAEFFKANAEQLIKQAIIDQEESVSADKRAIKLVTSFEEWKNAKEC